MAVLAAAICASRSSSTAVSSSSEGELLLVNEALAALGPRALQGPSHLLGLQLQQRIAGEQIGIFGAGVGQLSLDLQRARHSGGGHLPGPRKLFEELI